MAYLTPNLIKKQQSKDSMLKSSIMLCLTILLALFLAGCAEEDGGDPGKAIEQYLQARVDSDETALQGLVCAEMESQITMLASSFAAVEASLREVSCSAGDNNTVTCDGVIYIDYGTEDTELPAGSYQVKKEDGEWKMCGEA